AAEEEAKKTAEEAERKAREIEKEAEKKAEEAKKEAEKAAAEAEKRAEEAKKEAAAFVAPVFVPGTKDGSQQQTEYRQPQYQQVQQPQYQQRSAAPVNPVTKEEAKKAEKEAKKAAAAEKGTGIVSVWTFIGLTILFLIPVIGFISELIFTFAPKKKSLKHFALACLIFRIIGMLVFLLLAVLVIFAVINMPEFESVVTAAKNGTLFDGSIFRGSFFDGKINFDFHR
ncbi:MAG: hypothetical protein ILP01_03295, partial [Clostridia bacterium]|nr:hypothetical protein [Clostridia bacterium]